MTTLKNKILKNFIAGILACILIFSILVSFLLGRISRNYIEQTQYIKPDKVKNEFQYIMAKNNTHLLSERLLEYSKREDVNIEVLDSDKTSILRVDGLKNIPKSLLETKKYSLVSPEDKEYIGELQITYEKQSDAVEELRKNFTASVLIAITFSISIGGIIALILSYNITKPIISISDATLKIRDGDYDIKLDESVIEELENLKENITYLSINLKNQENIRKQYAQDISHELRTPLTNLQLYIEALKDGLVDLNDETLDMILNEVLRLNTLVTNLNKTFQDNIEYMKVNKESFNLSKHLDLIVKNFMPRSKANNINFATKIQENVIIYSDKEKITQIVQNLISNAFKAIGEDGNITIKLTENKEKIIIDVEDDGVGISKERLPMIFGRFYRIDDARNTKENGLGLGLSITKNFVESLGGRIKVSSELGKGTKFTVSFSK
ncbi:MAG: HAMP domain-containing sensor histidine kinase [Peptoniphilaceae bacterium]|nr:HAMP domain-containing sensor histidine kinase [Peptoniphilaceae bacterium]MDY6018157.1 HAMP domain-containing sensor histidine kinase [Anaerococcus sp.]